MKKSKLNLPKINYRITDTNIKKSTPFDYIFKILKKENIITLSFIQHAGGGKPYSLLIDFLEQKKIENINFYISNFIPAMLPNTFTEIKKICNRFNGKIKINHTHIKAIMIKTVKNYYVINSSSNLNSNTKIEQTDIFNSKADYEFFINFAENYFKLCPEETKI